MANALRNFEKRARAVESRHRKLADGYVTRMDKDGVMRHAPIRKFRLIRPRMIVYALGAFLAFKVFLVTQLGNVTYNERVMVLSQGSMVERAGAYVMAIDPATEWLAAALQPYVSPPEEIAAPAVVETAPLVSE